MDFRRIYAMGDIHGNLDDLISIIAWMVEDGMDLRFDLFIQIGDMIDGGPKSSEVIETLREMQENHPENVVILLGNHEDLFLNATNLEQYRPEFLLWWRQGGQATFKSYAENKEECRLERNAPLHTFTLGPDMQNDFTWLSTLPLFYETKDYIFVHAGLRPPFDAQSTSREDLLWIREDFLTSSYDWGKVVVHGHTANRNPEMKRNRINIDTNARHGRVTGVRLGKRQPLFFDAHGPYQLVEESARVKRV